jgi:hypothetical protein
VSAELGEDGGVGDGEEEGEGGEGWMGSLVR